ncbi:MAG: hypothetical protein VB130_04815, partial [Clostridium sp.]|nr:hypothetical protein [Clostridium sp.]
NNLKENKEEEILNIIPYIIDGIKWVCDVTRLTKDIQNEYINEKEMESELSKLVQAFESENFTLVGYLFEYEMLPILDRWGEIIKNSVTS